MLLILSLCLKGEVEGCSVLLMGQEEGDLIQKTEKNDLSKAVAKSGLSERIDQ